MKSDLNTIFFPCSETLLCGCSRQPPQEVLHGPIDKPSIALVLPRASLRQRGGTHSLACLPDIGARLCFSVWNLERRGRRPSTDRPSVQWAPEDIDCNISITFLLYSSLIWRVRTLSLTSQMIWVGVHYVFILACYCNPPVTMWESSDIRGIHVPDLECCATFTSQTVLPLHAMQFAGGSLWVNYFSFCEGFLLS